MSELTTEKYLMRVCATHGAACLKSESISGGFTDRMVLAPEGRVCFVELKYDSRGRISARQLVWHERLRRLGFRVDVLWNKGDVDRWAAEFFGEV